MATSHVITLLTDLGTTDTYVGIVKGILLTRAPSAQIVDLTHAAEGGSLYAAACLLATAYPYFSPGTVHLVLMDPGSSPKRRVLAAEVEGQYVVAPDDGVAAMVFEDHPPSHVVNVENTAFLMSAYRHTFHSRIIYAPVAAALSAGTRLEALGSPLDGWTQLPHGVAGVESDGTIVGQVAHIDRYGNLLTNIRASQIPPPPLIIKIGDAILDRVCERFSDVEVGRVLAHIGTTGNLEISINRGNAAERLFVSTCEQVTVTPVLTGSGKGL